AGLAVPAHVRQLGVRADFDHARLAAGLRQAPAGHHRHRHHALDGAWRADRDEPVAERRVAGRDLHRVPPARGPRLPPGRLRFSAGLRPATAGPQVLLRPATVRPEMAGSPLAQPKDYPPFGIDGPERRGYGRVKTN